MLDKLHQVAGPLPDLDAAAAEEANFEKSEAELWGWYLEWSATLSLAMGPQTPSTPPNFLAAVHAWHVLRHQLSQHTPSAQKPDVHCADVAFCKSSRDKIALSVLRQQSPRQPAEVHEIAARTAKRVIAVLEKQGRTIF